MESESIVGTIVGWGLIAALLIWYFTAVLCSHWREQKKRKSRDCTSR